MTNADFVGRYGPWAIVAGASEGLGVAYAHRLAERGVNLLLISRNAELLDKLVIEVRATHGIEARALALDLTTPDAVSKIIAATANLEIGLMVYNAGADSRVMDFLERPVAEAVRLTTLNITTPITLAHHFVTAMKKRGKGGLILMSSFASVVGTPGNAVYAASKAFSNVFAEGMWHEFGKFGVHVLGFIIGIVRTPAMERMGLSFEGLSGVADPYDLVDEALANIDKGPTLYASGLQDRVMRYRTLPRGEAVKEIAAFSDNVVANADKATANEKK
jgi:short-subunit dehydrogenase